MFSQLLEKGCTSHHVTFRKKDVEMLYYVKKKLSFKKNVAFTKYISQLENVPVIQKIVCDLQCSLLIQKMFDKSKKCL